MSTRALDLFQAYSEEKLPQEGGYVVSSFLDENSPYSIYEIVAYNGVKTIYLTSEGLTFQTDGNKLYVLTEPSSYHRKHVEPYHRDSQEQIPHRFSELDLYTCKNQTKILVSSQPIFSYSAFTILRPTGINFAFIFYNLPDVWQTMRTFFSRTLAEESAIPKIDSEKVARMIILGVRKLSKATAN